MRVFTGRSAGHSPEVLADPARQVARKRPAPFVVRFAAVDGVIRTPEGPVPVRRGEAVVTGPRQEEWPVSAERFDAKYRPLPPTRRGEAGTYLSLPLPVLALHLDEPFDVVLADRSPARLRGRAGDWLIDYGDGSLGVVQADVFDALYSIEPGAGASTR